MFQPTAPQRAILRYEQGGGGLFYSNDGAKTFGLVCSSAIDPSLTSGGGGGPTALTSDGTTLIGRFNGMFQDDGTGCTWSRIAKFEGVWISDFVTHPTDPNTTYTVSANGDPGSMNGIFMRDKDGKWTDVGTRDEILIGRLQVVDMGGGKLRFYESASRGQKKDDAGLSEPNYVIRVSNDEGKTWDEHVFENAGNNTLRLVVIDPNNPDRLVVTINRYPDDDSVLVSSDQGKSFTEYLKVTEVGGMTIMPDGRVWIGDSGDTLDPMRPHGLWSASSLDQAPKKIGDYVVQCVTYEPNSKTLYACQHWWLGTVDQKAGTFNTLFKLQDAASFLSCPGKDMAATCMMQLCGAYCGGGHFAQAPLCEAYDVPGYCGPSAADTGGSGNGTGGASAGTGTTSGGSGSAAVTGVGGNGNGTGGASTSMADAGTQGTAGSPHKSSSGGCAVAAAGTTAHGGGWLGLLAMALCALRRRKELAPRLPTP